MKYLATIKYGEEPWSKLFKSEDEAKQWIDENNNNFEHTASIDEIKILRYDDNGMFLNGYIYTKGAE